MVYFDNAATGYFKPRAVLDAVLAVINNLSVNPGRSGHRLSVSGAKIVSDTRLVLAQLFDASSDRVVFTKNCTEALNTAIFGSVKKGGHVITTTFEHNSVLRPLFFLKEQGIIQLDIAVPNKNESLVQSIERLIKPNTYMIAVTATSNVTGQSFPLKEIGRLAKQNDILFLVDGAQGGGHQPISIRDMNVSFLALAGHKGLYGIMGSGALILADDARLSPLTMGGTGSESLSLFQPEYYPERLESGTLSLPAIASLLEGAKYVQAHQEHFAFHLQKSTELMINGLKNIERIKTYSSPNSSGIVSFEMTGLDSNALADKLSDEFDIAVRGGFHCAPLTHEFYKTKDRGLVRASLAVQNVSREIDYFLSAVEKIAKSN